MNGDYEGYKWSINGRKSFEFLRVVYDASYKFIACARQFMECSAHKKV